MKVDIIFDLISLMVLLICAYFVFIATAGQDSTYHRAYYDLMQIKEGNFDNQIKDPWGNNYKVLKYCDETGKERVLIYSLGLDGLSISGGFDRDDINTYTTLSNIKLMNINVVWSYLACLSSGVLIRSLFQRLIL